MNNDGRKRIDIIIKDIEEITFDFDADEIITALDEAKYAG